MAKFKQATNDVTFDPMSTETVDSDGARAVREDVFVPLLSTEGTNASEIPTLPGPGPDTAVGSSEPRAKRKYTRRADKRKPEPTPIVDPSPSPEELDALGAAVGEALGIVGRVVASRRGEHWNLTDSEKQRVGRLWAVALAPYMSGAGRWAPFAIAGLATVGVIVPRIEEDGQQVKALARESVRPSADAADVALVTLARTNGEA